MDQIPSPPSPSRSHSRTSAARRPYRSKKKKPCNACRRRRGRCIREASSGCLFCHQRGIECVVEGCGAAGRIPDSQSSTPNTISTPQTESNHTAVGGHGNDRPKEEADAEHPNKRTAQHIGPSGDHDSFILCHGMREVLDDDVDGMWTRWMRSSNAGDSVCFVDFPDDHLDAHPSYYPRNVVEQAVKPFRDDLLRAYYEYVQPSFALLGPQTASSVADSVCLRTAMYGLAQRHCPAARSVDPWLFTDFNKQALNIERHAPKLETVEAALLFAQRHAHILRAPTMPGLSAEVGSIVGMCHDLALNIDPTDWDIPEAEKRRRKRVWWGMFMQDKWTALTLGRPPYLHDGQSDVPALEMSDFAADDTDEVEASQIQPARTFIGMTTLSMILSDILAHFFTVKAIKADRQPLEKIQSISSMFELQLENWRLEHLDPILETKTFPDPTGSLELAYYVVQITLYRAVVRALFPQTSETVELWTHIREQGRAVTASVINLLENLPVARSASFWWSASKLNFSIAGSFMISMFLCSVSDEDAQSWIDKVIFYRKLLYAHTAGFEITKHASIRLDLLINRGIHKQPITQPLSPRQGDRNRLNREDDVPMVSAGIDMDQEWLFGHSSPPPSFLSNGL